MPGVSQSSASFRLVAGLPRHGRAFTLVELLVVIGIIALLIAILMPALAGARQLAQRTVCAAKLEQMLVAAQTHASDHKGYYPLAGVLPGFATDQLNDSTAQKYQYFGYNDPQWPPLIAPITISLATEMSYHAIRVANDDQLAAVESDDKGFLRSFLRPSEATSLSEIPVQTMLYDASYNQDLGNGWGEQYMVGYYEPQSYIYNEAVLGWADAVTSGRLQGKASLIRQSSRTMFAADGLGGTLYSSRFPYNLGMGMSTLYNISPNPPVTMTDALLGDGNAGDPECFDTKRHHGKINVAFCDGHVETRNITPKDLSTIFLLAP